MSTLNLPGGALYLGLELFMIETRIQAIASEQIEMCSPLNNLAL